MKGSILLSSNELFLMGFFSSSRVGACTAREIGLQNESTELKTDYSPHRTPSYISTSNISQVFYAS